MDISISIIIAIYNRKDELTELLHSLSIQQDVGFDVVIVDDGSSVELLSVVDLYRGRLDIQYFKKQNTGPGLSRNFGAERAKNNWLVFLDSDVVVPQDYIKNIKNNLQNQPTDAFGGADKADENFTNLQKAISYSMTSVFTTGGIRGSKKAVSKFQPRSFNMGVSKAAFSAVGGFSDMRVGEDPDLSMKLWENGFLTCFYENIAVYHKRRTSLKKFSKQVYQFGVARPILNQRHPQYTKLTFWFPTLFLLGFFWGLLLAFWTKIPLLLYVFYTLLIFIHSFIKMKSLQISILTVIAVYIQMFSYGWGFLHSWIKLNLLKYPPKKAFPKHFY